MKYLHPVGNHIGRRLGMIIIFARLRTLRHEPRWAYVCDCGIVGRIYHRWLRTNKPQSCGCVHREVIPIDKRGVDPNPDPPTELVPMIDFKRVATYPSTLAVLKEIHTEMLSDADVTMGKRWKSFSKFKQDVIESYLQHVRNNGVSNTIIRRRDKKVGYLKSNTYWDIP